MAGTDELMDWAIEQSTKNKPDKTQEEIDKEISDAAAVVEAEKDKQTEKDKVEKPTEHDWKSLGEEYTSFADVQKGISESKKEVERLRQAENDLKKKETDYTSQIAKLKESSIDDPDLARLNKLKKDNPEDYKLYARVKLVGDANPVDLLKQKLIKKSPSFKDKLDEVDEIIKSKYGLDVDVPSKLISEDATLEEIEARDREITAAQKKIRLGKAQLQMDADEYSSELLKKFDGIELDAPIKQKTEDEIKAEIDQRKTTWTSLVEKITDGFEVVSIPGKNEKGEIIEILKFPVPKDKRSEYGKEAVNFVVDENMPYEKESLGRAFNFLKSRAKEEFEADINFKIMEHGRNMEADEWEKLAHNISSVSGHENRAGSKKISKKEEADSATEKQLGL